MMDREGKMKKKIKKKLFNYLIINIHPPNRG